MQSVADSARAVLHQVLARPEYQWREESSTSTVLRRWWRQLVEWLEQLNGSHPGLFRLLAWGLVVVLGAIALHAIWVLVRATRRPAHSTSGPGATGTAVVRDASWFAAEATRLARAGQYRAAMQAEFARLTLDLDRADLLRFHPSKTPREYLADLRLAEPSGRDFRNLVNDLYRYAFAGAPCDAGTWDAFRERAAFERYATSA